MKSKYFDDPKVALEVFIETFQRAGDDPAIREPMLGLNQLVAYDYTEDDPVLYFWVDARGGDVTIGSGQPPGKPDVTMVNSVDTAHQAWSNKLNPMMAVATRKIRPKGSATSLLKLAPLLKKIAPIYNTVLEEKGLSHIKL